MKSRIIHLSISFILLLSITGSGQGCANQSNVYTFTYNGKTYEVVKEMKNWVDAAACAVERGGYLVEINDLNEQNAVYDAIINGAGVSPTYTTVPDGGGVAYIWIGATDKVTEGTWLWDGNNDGTGTNFWNGQGSAGTGGGSAVGGAYVNWGGASTGTYHEPDNYNGSQNAAAIGLRGWPGGTGALGIASEWNDINMSNTLYFVIEKDNTSGMNPLEEREPLTFFPNPVKDLLTIRTNHPGKIITSAKVNDLAGKEVLIHESINSTALSFNLGDLAAGTYHVSVKLNDGIIVNKKVIVL